MSLPQDLPRLAFESSALLCVALLVERRLARPARAHAWLVAGIGGTLALVLLGSASRRLGWGLLPAVFQDVVHLEPPVLGVLGAAASRGATPSLETILLGAWALGSSVLFVRLASAAWRGSRRVARARCAARPDREGIEGDASVASRLVARIASELGLPRPPRLCFSDEVAGPVVWGFGARASVLLPATLAAAPRAILDPVLRHELAHVRRRDHVTALCAEVAFALFFWNPLVWIARARLAERAEEACDAWALAGRTQPADYAQLLVGLLPGPRRELVLSASGTRRRVERRLAAILAHDASRALEPRAGRTVLATLLVCGLCAASALGLAQRDNVGAERPNVTLLDAAWERGGVRALPGELVLDPVPAGGLGQGVVWVANLSAEPIEVSAVRPSCGCTTVRAFEPTTLAPGEALALELSIEAPDEPGATKEKTVAVKLDGADDLSIPIRVSTLP